MKGATNDTLALRFGALSDKISDQLKAQGLSAPGAAIVSHWQKDADSIARLAIRSLLTGAQVRAARQKLLKQIASGVTKSEAK